MRLQPTVLQSKLLRVNLLADTAPNARSDGSADEPNTDPDLLSDPTDDNAADGRAVHAEPGRNSRDRRGWSVPLFAVHFSVGASWAWCSLHGA